MRAIFVKKDEKKKKKRKNNNLVTIIHTILYMHIYDIIMRLPPKGMEEERERKEKEREKRKEKEKEKRKRKEKDERKNITVHFHWHPNTPHGADASPPETAGCPGDAGRHSSRCSY